MNAQVNTPLFSSAFFEANNGTAYHKALAQFEKPLLQEVMTECRGNQTKAAEMLGLNRGTFRKKLIQHGLHK
jgi:DNA-binding protein Fis